MTDEIDSVLNEWIDDVEKEKRLTINYGSGDFYYEHLRDLYIWTVKKIREEK